MNIMELGAIGELVGGVAVLVTLIYLAIQLRQNTRTVRAQVQQETARMSTDIALGLTQEDYDLIVRASLDLQAVSESSLRRFACNGWPELLRDALLRQRTRRSRGRLLAEPTTASYEFRGAREGFSLADLEGILRKEVPEIRGPGASY